MPTQLSTKCATLISTPGAGAFKQMLDAGIKQSSNSEWALASDHSLSRKKMEMSGGILIITT